MSQDDAPDVLVFPPLVAVAVPLLCVLLEFLIPLKILPPFGTPWTLGVGVGLIVAAVLLARAGMRVFKAAETNINPRRPALKIVRDGPYRFTRNPMYLGMVILQFGLALAFSLDWALLGGVAVLVILHFGVVLREEAYLTEKFGAEYTVFLSETRRWL